MTRLVDSHHHLWDLEKNVYPWNKAAGTEEARERRSYLVEDYVADAGESGLYRSVHVEGNFDPAHPAGETAWLQAIADVHGFPHGIVGFAALEDPGVGGVLEAHCRYDNFRGVRQILNWDPDPFLSQCARGDLLSDRHWREGFALLERFGLSFDLQAHPWQMPEAASLAASFPGVQIIVDHIGMPVYRGESGWDSWRTGIDVIAGRPNVSIKLSGFGMFDVSWTAESIRPGVELVLERFGPDRCMFGSNFPVDKRWATFAEAFDRVSTAVGALSEVERDAVFAGNAIRFYRLEP